MVNKDGISRRSSKCYEMMVKGKGRKGYRLWGDEMK